jgi:hypothetical protein
MPHIPGGEIGHSVFDGAKDFFKGHPIYSSFRHWGGFSKILC